MLNGTWKDVSTPPKCNGRYLVKFYFPHRHPTERTEIVYRDFKDGQWEPPYYDNPNEDSKLCGWFESEEDEQCRS